MVGLGRVLFGFGLGLGCVFEVRSGLGKRVRFFPRVSRFLGYCNQNFTSGWGSGTIFGVGSGSSSKSRVFRSFLVFRLGYPSSLAMTMIKLL